MVTLKGAKWFPNYSDIRNVFILFFVTIIILPSFESCKSPTSPISNILPDTTSHNYVWQTFILGDGNSSILYDVSIINDTLAYAVGEIYLKDSTGQFENEPYGLAIWNGKSWQLKKLYFYETGGTVIFSDIRGIIYLNSTDIWFAAGSIFQWDGYSDQAQLIYSRLNLPYQTSSVEKIWGINDGNLYAVGNAGTLLFSQGGSSWQQLNLGTTANIFDVWGTTDTKTGTTTVYVPISDLNNDNGIKKIFKLNGTQVDSIQWNTGKNVMSVWGTPDGSSMYAAGDGLFENKGNGWEEIPFDTNTRFFEIRGDASNNIFARGIRLVPPLDEVVAHYNGSSWHEYPELSGFYNYGIAIKGKTVIIVGENGNQAVAVIGRRID